LSPTGIKLTVQHSSAIDDMNILEFSAFNWILLVAWLMDLHRSPFLCAAKKMAVYSQSSTSPPQTAHAKVALSTGHPFL
jgi:hypothetical protein